jgi:hypothetical protein
VLPKRFAGVFEAVSIRKLGFPFRRTHQNFFEYFKILSTYDHDKWMQARKTVKDQGVANSKSAFTSLAKRLWEVRVCVVLCFYWLCLERVWRYRKLCTPCF